ncbi:hypothetical protein ECANGB1_834 [Enterospora canceri]|uniref:Uncharacterized protein n=1 Tax=Enterospora canceri TaxID=1081671 RepID=A0A1Y1S7B0_9MICR|nr:hypothetical protein ECANGB1_834 [Enterospora canceri]
MLDYSTKCICENSYKSNCFYQWCNCEVKFTEMEQNEQKPVSFIGTLLTRIRDRKQNQLKLVADVDCCNCLKVFIEDDRIRIQNKTTQFDYHEMVEYYTKIAQKINRIYLVKLNNKTLRILAVDDTVLWGKQVDGNQVNYSFLGCDEKYSALIVKIDLKSMRSRTSTICPMVFINHINKTDTVEFMKNEIGIKMEFMVLEESMAMRRGLDRIVDHFGGSESQRKMTETATNEKSPILVWTGVVALLTFIGIRLI